VKEDQAKVEQAKIEQDSADQDQTEQNKTGQNKTGAKQDPAELAEDPLETGHKNDAGDDTGYVATSKLDPFMPLIREQKETVVPKIEKSDKPRRILTPLEKMDLSQIKLVAVVIAGTRKIAMVEEATGKGYEVNIGTYMGKNEGQVVDITFESIVVKENITDFKGNQAERFHEIKLHKTDNGE
ncbi:MAG: pilus assembly protein PilP, partial [Desulfobacteraceae bacterium]|nr:pilus assembly protein PilP [Desulfobacteraceae bacterium]